MHRIIRRKINDQVFCHSRSGFTLIEIMIVLVIIGAVLALAVPKLSNSKNKIKEEVKHIAVVVKEVHNAARLENKTYRIVLSMDEKKPHSYWIESAAGNVTLLNEDQKKKLKDADAKRSLIEKNNGFELSTSILKDAVKLPKQLFIDKVEFADKREITAGTAAVHFFAQGLVQEVAIHLSDRKTLVWTIYISPLTAHTVVYEKNISLKEIETR